MNKRFAIQHIWFNNQDAEVTLVGRMQDDVLTYESKLLIKMSELNGVISKLQKTAGIEASEVQHINAHATSTQVGDCGELAAIRAVFGAGSGVAITSTKSSTGHLLGAAGGIEAIFTILALRDQVVPPTLNLINPDEAADGLDLVSLGAQLDRTQARCVDEGERYTGDRDRAFDHIAGRPRNRRGDRRLAFDQGVD